MLRVSKLYSRALDSIYSLEWNWSVFGPCICATGLNVMVKNFQNLEIWKIQWTNADQP